MKLNQPEGTKEIRFILAFERPIAFFIRNDNDAIMYNSVKDNLNQFTLRTFAKWCAERGVFLQLMGDMTNEQVRDFVEKMNRRNT